MGRHYCGFCSGLTWTQKQYDSIWVIVDRLTKYSDFIPVNSTYSVEDYAWIFTDDIVCFHGILLSIISDGGAKFTFRFWRSFKEGLGTKVKLSTSFHPKTDGQAECTIQTPQDMPMDCIIDFKGNW